mgnify:CR=1 FL=1
MANKYAYNKETNEAKTARAMAKSLKISPKHCVEICNAIRGMEVTKAKNYLEDVIDMKGQEGWAAGRYPVKAAEQVLKVLENAEANAEYKGMDTENLFIEHISSHRGVVLPGVIPRAFGRMTPFNTPTTHIQIVLQEAN